MTYTDAIRQLARQESGALRGWAKAGKMPPRCAPIDRWAEWERLRKTSSTTFGAAA